MTTDNIFRSSWHFTDMAMFITYQIAVTHQLYLVTIDADNAVNDVATAVNPGQHYIADSQTLWLDEFHTLLSANDKGQHAITLYRQCHPLAFIHQLDDLRENLVVGQYLLYRFHYASLVTASMQVIAAALSGKHSR
jgi:hypothetical protein